MGRQPGPTYEDTAKLWWFSLPHPAAVLGQSDRCHLLGDLCEFHDNLTQPVARQSLQLYKLIRYLVQARAMLRQQCQCSQVALIRDCADGVVNLTAKLIRVVRPPEVSIILGNGAHVRHAELSHHGAGHALNLLQVTPGARSNLPGAKDDLLSSRAAQGTGDARLEAVGRDEALVLVWREPSQALA